MIETVRKCIMPLALLCALITAIGCSHPGSQFVGKSVNKANPRSHPIEISRNGDQFLFVEDNEKFGANYADGDLAVSAGPATVRVTYVKSSDTLLTPDGEYKRAE